jgi:hypothetical protein
LRDALDKRTHWLMERWDFVADNPGLTLFHRHQQLHMDFGFVALLGLRLAGLLPGFSNPLLQIVVRLSPGDIGEIASPKAQPLFEAAADVLMQLLDLRGGMPWTVFLELRYSAHIYSYPVRLRGPSRGCPERMETRAERTHG